MPPLFFLLFPNSHRAHFHATPAPWTNNTPPRYNPQPGKFGTVPEAFPPNAT